MRSAMPGAACPSGSARPRRLCRSGAPLPIAPIVPGGDVGSIESLTLLTMGAFGVVGFVRGARREWLSLASAVAAYAAIEWFWPSIAAALNRVVGLLPAAVVGGGAPAAEPSAYWASASSDAPLVPVDGPTEIWQIAVFVTIVLAGYLVSQRVGRARIGSFAALVRLPDLVERLIGALMGATTGYIFATVVLSRLFPSLGIALLGPGAQLSGILGRAGPPGVFAVVALIVLFGVLSLGSRGRQVFGG